VFEKKRLWFLQCSAKHSLASAVYATANPSICMSIKLQYCVKMRERRGMRSSPVSLVFWCQEWLVGDNRVDVKFECKEFDPLRRMCIAFHARSTVQSTLQTFWFSISLASVKIYLQYLASRFHRICRRWAYKSYPPHLHFVSTLPCSIYIFISETENSRENSNNVYRKRVKSADQLHRRNSIRNNVCCLPDCMS